MQFSTLVLSISLIGALGAPYVPSSLKYRASINDIPLDKRQTSTNSTTEPNATVTVCTEPDFRGECHQSTWPVNTCIDLKGYRGITESFGVEGFECLVMQGKCDAATGYVSVGDSGEDKEIGEDLTEFSWIKNATSYMCFTELSEMRRFVLRTKAARVTVHV
ncbi:hypothetical protein DOTSEDRAFT_21387 [Dothistroma septosporum NZE10]|uniref:Uncharacterized protein n=1 Tax=Dothistroma septosporum (strain NZE10 / CBS 128990) TaxID=675120 RepID=N1PVX5_DOTSN|nr:hypothetical protein DOTSEDRAFT_21387 [Dothistroma septosporum NZE10]